MGLSIITSGLKNPKNGKKLKYEVVETRGTCCWEVRSRTRGGKFFEIGKPEITTKDWPIKKVTLIECSTFLESEYKGTKCDSERDNCELPVVNETFEEPIASTSPSLLPEPEKIMKDKGNLTRNITSNPTSQSQSGQSINYQVNESCIRLCIVLSIFMLY